MPLPGGPRARERVFISFFLNLSIHLLKQIKMTKSITTKTWNLGENCLGGVIHVEFSGGIIHVIGKEWDASVGWSRNSDQSNAKEFTRCSVHLQETGAYRKISDFLDILTTSYYAAEILTWMEMRVGLKHQW
jgi:hypothetical protein